MIGTFIDATAGTVVQRELTDDEKVGMFLPQVKLSADKLTFQADGIDFATITAQLMSVPLSDGKQQPIAMVHTLILFCAERKVELTTDETGKATHEIAAKDEGEYSVVVQNLASNTLVFQAVLDESD